ncbi:MAG: PqqD family protein [Verrucomicrobiales bacterium]
MSYYQLNDESVSAELIDDEVVIVHFGTGNYYSLRGATVTLWQALIAGVGVEEIKTLFPEAASRIDEFVSQLLSEELLRNSPIQTERETLEADFPWSELQTNDPQLLNLHFERFGDMQMLLLSDPIHEIGESGWPTLTED